LYIKKSRIIKENPSKDSVLEISGFYNCEACPELASRSIRILISPESREILERLSVEPLEIP